MFLFLITLALQWINIRIEHNFLSAIQMFCMICRESNGVEWRVGRGASEESHDLRKTSTAHPLKLSATKNCPMQHNNFITESEMENIANLSRSLSACHVTQLSTLFNICSKYLFDQ